MAWCLHAALGQSGLCRPFLLSVSAGVPEELWQATCCYRTVPSAHTVACCCLQTASPAQFAVVVNLYVPGAGSCLTLVACLHRGKMLTSTAWRGAAGLACSRALVHRQMLPQQQGELGPSVQSYQCAALDHARHAGRVSALDRVTRVGEGDGVVWSGNILQQRRARPGLQGCHNLEAGHVGRQPQEVAWVHQSLMCRPERAGACGFAACTCCAGLTPFAWASGPNGSRTGCCGVSWVCCSLSVGGCLADWRAGHSVGTGFAGVRVLRAGPCRASLLSPTWAGTRHAQWLGRCTYQQACSGQTHGRRVRCERSLCRACCLPCG